MANWYGSARSNYVQVENMEALKLALDPFLNEITIDDCGEKGVCFTAQCGEYGGWPTTVYVETIYKEEENGPELEREDQLEFDPAIHIAPHLKEGQVLVMMECGAEKLRYLTGWAQAYQAITGDCVSVSMDDIYKKAALAFETPENDISLAQY